MKTISSKRLFLGQAKRQSRLLILALLLVAWQGVWAADRNYWYPTAETDKPEFKTEYSGKSNVVVIKTPAQLAYVTKHFDDESGYDDNKDWSELNYYLDADIDMGVEHSWLPLGRSTYTVTKYKGTFWGNGHTITYMIWDLDEENQGLFSTIHKNGKVYDVNVVSTISSVEDYVGGIAGECYGLIQNCTVKASISSNQDKVGGITGFLGDQATIKDCKVSGWIDSEQSWYVGGIAGKFATNSGYRGKITNCWVSANICSTYNGRKSTATGGIAGVCGIGVKIEYCCVTGNVKAPIYAGGITSDVTTDVALNHVTVYGTVTSSEEPANAWVGDDRDANYNTMKYTLANNYTTFNQAEYDAAIAAGNTLYANAIKYPYAVNIKSYGNGEFNEIAPGFCPGQTVTLTAKTGSREVKEMTVKGRSGQVISVSGNTTDGFTFTMPREDVNIVVWFDLYSWPTEGDGTEEAPYTIKGNEEWSVFASRVNNGDNSYEGKYIRLDADLDVSTVIGYDDYKPFKGTFLGNGHTLTITRDSYPEHDDIPWQGVSLFHYISGATIKDLKVTGCITSQTVYTSGLVGFAEGTNLIENCVVTTTLNIKSDYAGGIVGNGLNSNTTIKNCVFAGTINGVGGDRANIGGIWGYCNGATPTLENCLEKGTYTHIASMHPVGLQGASGTINNCYYVIPQIGTPDNACTVNGAQQARTISASEGAFIRGLGEATATYGSDGITAYAKGIRYDGTYYAGSGETVSLTLKHDDSAGCTFRQYVASDGTLSGQTETSATLTMPDADVTISADWTQFTFAGTGTAEDPYIIGTTDQWNEFATVVNSGYTFSEQFVKLTDHIIVSSMAGTDYVNSFQGTFDGNGQTLTFNNGTAENPFTEEYCAPFRHVRNAVIKDLHVDGTIYTSAKKAAGIVGESLSDLDITGCRSSVDIHSSVNGDGTHGGLVSTLSGKDNDITIDGCVFDGSFATTSGTNNCGGFIGWPVYNTPTITNSLMKPGSVDAGMLVNTFARWHTTYEPTITNCYYVEKDNLPTDQGTQAFPLAALPAHLGEPTADYDLVKAYASGILFDGTYYMAAANISLADAADNSATLSNADGYLANVTLAGRTLYKDGAWNTLCLPFSVVLAGSPLEGAEVRTLTSGSVSGSTLNLTFGDAVTELVAGTPYIIKWEKASDYVDDAAHNIVSPVFEGVTIDATERNFDNGMSGDLRVRFLGTYKNSTFSAEDKSILLMGGENTLYYPLGGASIGSCRAYFKIGDDGALLTRQFTDFSITFGEDGESTGLEAKDWEQGARGKEAWYTLDGRRLNGKPSQRGIYIGNGKKIVIK